MSGVTLAVAPRTDPNETATTSAPTTQQNFFRQQQPAVGGVMGSLRVIELQLVAFIMVFSASGLVPLLDLVFPAFISAYLLVLSCLVFPSPPPDQWKYSREVGYFGSMSCWEPQLGCSCRLLMFWVVLLEETSMRSGLQHPTCSCFRFRY